ncbi:hypothetical protein [Lysobacter humi (ex Lee et al. 2017)]
MNNPHTQAPSGNGLSGGADGDLRTQVGSVAEQVKVQGQERIESTRQATATTLEKLAEGVRDAASQLERDGTVGNLSGYIVQMSETMTRVASGLRDKSGDDLLHEVGRIARENPTVFVAGAVALGFGLTRFAKASTKHEHGSSAGSGADVGSDLAASASDTGLALSSAGGRGSQDTVFSAGSLGGSGSTTATGLGSRGASPGTAAASSAAPGASGMTGATGGSGMSAGSNASGTGGSGSAGLGAAGSTGSPTAQGYGETPSSSPPTGSTGYGAGASASTSSSDVSAPAGTALGGTRNLDARGDQGIASGGADTGLTDGTGTTPGLSAGAGASLGVRSGEDRDGQGGQGA